MELKKNAEKSIQQATQRDGSVAETMVASICTSSESPAYVTQSLFCTVLPVTGTAPLKRDT
jgi:hypothetical protein